MGKRGPQPGHKGQRKEASLNLRISAALRARLTREAEASGETLSELVERRISDSQFADDSAQPAATSWFLQRLGNQFSAIEAMTRKDWMTDAYTFDQVESFVRDWLARLRPRGEVSTPVQFRGGRTQPAEMCLANAVGSLVLAIAATDAGMRLPSGLGRLVRQLRGQLNLSAKEEQEVKVLAGLIHTGAVKLDFGGRQPVATSKG